MRSSGSEISGALADDALSDADLAAGRYDAAAIEIHLVDWSEPSLHVLLAKGVLGEVRREGAGVRRGAALARRSPQRGERPALYRDLLGRSRRQPLPDRPDHPTFRGNGTVTSLNGTSSFFASGLGALRRRLVHRGAAGLAERRERRPCCRGEAPSRDAGGVTLELWQAMPEPIAAGDTFVVTAGCDKRFGTCRDRFSNAVNFRGFPHIPGNDFVTRYAVSGEPGNNGGSLILSPLPRSGEGGRSP